MEKRAIIVTDGNEVGCRASGRLYEQFLLSCRGGLWGRDEVCVMLGASRTQLLAKIAALKEKQPDYCVVFFSGHGQIEDDDSVLQLCDGEIKLSELKYIAHKQLTILEACRAEPCKNSYRGKSSPASLLNESVGAFASEVKAAYNKCIEDANEEQAVLYSCRKGGVSYVEEDGGVFTKALLTLSDELHDEVETLGPAVARCRDNMEPFNVAMSIDEVGYTEQYPVLDSIGKFPFSVNVEEILNNNVRNYFITAALAELKNK